MAHIFQLNDPQVIYLQRIEHPKSPEDVLLALQNTLTPIYKNMMKQIITGELTEVIIESIIAEHLSEAYVMKKFEKQALVDHVLKQVKLNELILPEIRKLIPVTGESQKLYNDILGLRNMSDNLCNRWKHALERQMLHTAFELQRNRCRLTVADDAGHLQAVSATDPAGLAYIKSMYGGDSLAPVKFVTNILQSYYLVNDHNKPPVSIFIPTRNAMRIAYQIDNELESAFQHFSFASDVPDENPFDYGKLLIQLRQNKKANSIIHKAMNEECCKIFDMSYVIAEELANKNIAYFKLKHRYDR